MQIRVMRNPGDKQGPDIIDSLLTDEASGRARGQGEINYYVSKKIISANCPLQSFLDTGTLVQVSDSKQTRRGKVILFALSLTIDPSGGQYYPSTSMNIEMVDENE